MQGQHEPGTSLLSLSSDWLMSLWRVCGWSGHYFGNGENIWHAEHKGRFTRYDFVAYDKLTTGLRHQFFSCNSNLQLTYDCRVRHQKCRRILKHVLKSYDNRRYMQSWMTRVVCDFLHDASSARSRNRMRQSYAKVVPSKSASRVFLECSRYHHQNVTIMTSQYRYRYWYR